MPDQECPDDDLDQVSAARLELRYLGSQRTRSFPSITPPSRRPKMSTRTFLSLKNLACLTRDLLIADKGGQAGIGPDKQVVVDLASPFAVEVLGAKVG